MKLHDVKIQPVMGIISDPNGEEMGDTETDYAKERNTGDWEEFQLM